MWNLPKGNAFLPGTSLAQMEQMYRAESKAKPKLRLLAAIHRKKGKSLDEIARHVDVSRNTVHGWLRRFSVQGAEAKDSIKQTGRPARLTLRQRAALVKILERGPPHNPSGLWTTKELRAIIERKFKRTYVLQHVWRLLVSLGFSIQRPRKRHYLRASDEEIALFKKKLGDRRATIGEKGLLWARRMKRPSASSPS